MKLSYVDLAAKFRANASNIEDRPGDKNATECAASLTWRYAASDLEDVIAQQAQPLHPFASDHKCGIDPCPQQAQPEMPTREKIIEAVSASTTVLGDYPHGAQLVADAVLALFAPKEIAP